MKLMLLTDDDEVLFEAWLKDYLWSDRSDEGLGDIKIIYREKVAELWIEHIRDSISWPMFIDKLHRDLYNEDRGGDWPVLEEK